jgi:hypothetical protein
VANRKTKILIIFINFTIISPLYIVYYSFFTLLSIIYFKKSSTISPNVLAVYEVLGARISKRKGVQSILTLPLRLQGTQNLAERKPHKGRKPDCGFS